jgi:hypothetical protein
MLKPLGLPPGSVRALLLLAVAARAVLDLRAGADPAIWLVVALVIAGVAYFARRQAGPSTLPAPDAPRPAPPLGLPTGSVRLLFLGVLGYGAYLWLEAHSFEEAKAPVGWVFGAFVLGVLARAFLRKMREPADAGTGWFWHLQALVALGAAAGLVTFGVTRPTDLADWVEPLLAAVVTYYFGSR